MSEEADRQRIDKWLWFARIVKTRALAQDLAASGHVRLNSRRVDAPAQPVRRGDVLTIGLGTRVLVLKVLGFAARRGTYPEALALYEDLAPKPPADAGENRVADAADLSAPAPARGDGRPSKRDRRRFDRIGSGET